MTAVSMSEVFTDEGAISMPEREITTPLPEYTYVPIRGYGWTMAVKHGENYIGWIMVDALGYGSVGAWINRKEKS